MRGGGGSGGARVQSITVSIIHTTSNLEMPISVIASDWTAKGNQSTQRKPAWPGENMQTPHKHTAVVGFRPKILDVWCIATVFGPQLGPILSHSTTLHFYIHSSIHRLPGSGLQEQQPEQGCPDLPCSSHLRNVISPVCSGLSQGFFPAGHTWSTSPGRHPW